MFLVPTHIYFLHILHIYLFFQNFTLFFGNIKRNLYRLNDLHEGTEHHILLTLLLSLICIKFNMPCMVHSQTSLPLFQRWISAAQPSSLILTRLPFGNHGGRVWSLCIINVVNSLFSHTSSSF